jgi:hypothetical protein
MEKVIPNTYIDRAFVVREGEDSVKDASESPDDTRFILVKLVNPGSQTTYRVIPWVDLADQAADIKLKDMPYRLTKPLPRNTITSIVDVNDNALNHPRVSYLVVDSQDSPLGVFIAKEGESLGEPKARELPPLRTINCPKCRSDCSAIKGDTSPIVCTNGHSFERNGYRNA